MSALLFINLHAMELDDDSLISAAAPLSRHAARVVLEVTERAPLEKIRDVTARVAQLRALGYRIAVDDLGAGYAGLTSFAHLEPEVVKVDMSLDPRHRSLADEAEAAAIDRRPVPRAAASRSSPRGSRPRPSATR